MGGAQICVKRLVENFPADKVESFIYPLRCDKPDIQIEAKVLTHNYKPYSLRKFLNILQICRKYKIDIIHAHLEKSVIAALLMTFIKRIPVVIHEHGSIRLPGFNYSTYRLVLKKLGNRSSAYIAVSNEMRKTLHYDIGINLEKIKVIYNAFDCAFICKEDSRNELKQKLNIPPDKIILGFAGRLNEVKGPDILIRTVSLLNSEKPKYHLVLAGDGPQKGMLSELAGALDVQDDVQFLGYCENMPEVMNSFDLGLIPSRYEAFGITAVEFMRMKIPVISSRAGGLTEIITNERNGLIVDDNTPEQFSTCIKSLIADSDLKQRLIENAFIDSNNYNIGTQVEAIMKLYEEILS